ncbi:sulfurtransferase [Amphibacillus cookii]|uniref:sulfurtransferase n=1 Tax=Amphibacillus cookii TaxID=767787 RepID=UPI00195BAB8C|nr:sulfurtransferase [Amphibacillus cookii]MBM7543226.1 thiosulfate/3-mercaptopyruvate sulfurtransferase [Amphibacillus cookii]
MNFVIDKKWLAENLNKENVKIVDCRFDLAQSAAGEKLYKESHIPGAFFFDLEKHLSSPVLKHGGRHPLPDITQLKAELEKAGIDHRKRVVAYDGGSGLFASRLWWLLSYMGHEEVYVLNEGFSGWLNAGFPITNQVPSSEAVTFKIHIQEEMLASFKEVKEIVNKKNKSPKLVDSRAPERYLGKVEPLDRIAGHIPGAINIFWEEGLSQGSFKTSEAQKDRFSELRHDEPIIVYCGSGVSATPNYIALKMAGYNNVKLYAGSYSDWVSYEDTPVEKG